MKEKLSKNNSIVEKKCKEEKQIVYLKDMKKNEKNKEKYNLIKELDLFKTNE